MNTDVQSSRSSASAKIVVGKNYKSRKGSTLAGATPGYELKIIFIPAAATNIGTTNIESKPVPRGAKTSPAGQIRRMQMRILWMPEFCRTLPVGLCPSSFPNQARLKKSHARDKSIGGKASICRCFDSPNVKGIGVPICKAPKRISAASSR